MALHSTLKNQEACILYLVDEVEKEGLLMVSLEWMMHIVDGIWCC
jgi:hypothetical protein